MPGTAGSGSLRDVWNRSEQVRYLALGVWNTAFAYLAYLALYGLFHGRLHYLVIGVLVHVAAVTNAFLCQRAYVFRSTAAWLPAYLRFHLVQLAVLAGSVGGLALLVEGFQVSPFVGQMTVMTGGVVAGYLLNRRFSFRVNRS